MAPLLQAEKELNFDAQHFLKNPNEHAIKSRTKPRRATQANTPHRKSSFSIPSILAPSGSSNEYASRTPKLEGTAEKKEDLVISATQYRLRLDKPFRQK